MFLIALQWAAAAATIVAATLVARNKRQFNGLAFWLFYGAALSWMVAAALQDNGALMVQNAVLAGINVAGLHGWYGRRPADP